MQTYTIDKNAMKAVKAILRTSEKKNVGSRSWMRYAYLYSQGLILTDGTRLLKIRDANLEWEFRDFIREVDGVVILKLEGDNLTVFGDSERINSEIGTMEKMIPSVEKADRCGKDFLVRFHCGSKKATGKQLSASMLNMAILTSGRWFNPELFDGMGVRPWYKVTADGPRVAFSGDKGEVFICMGLANDGGIR